MCDCLELLFPSKVPKVLQVLMGSFPITYLSEPYSAMRYLAERLDMVSLLRIQHPYDEKEWSATDICDGWAKKRGFFIAGTAWLDTHRAANPLLKLLQDEKIFLCLPPVGYISEIGYWKEHPEIEEILAMQTRNKLFQNKQFNLSSEEEYSDDSYSNKSDIEESCNFDSMVELSLDNKFSVLQVEEEYE